MLATRSVFPKVHWLVWVALALPLIVLSATPANWPPWAFMWLLAFAVYSTCKLITWSAASTGRVPLWRECAYLVAWPGLDAAAFLHSDPSPPTRPNAQERMAALWKALIGIMLFWTAQYWTLESAAVRAKPYRPSSVIANARRSTVQLQFVNHRSL